MEDDLTNPLTGEKESEEDKARLDSEMGKLMGEMAFYQESIDLTAFRDDEIESKLREVASSFIEEGRKELPLLLCLLGEGESRKGARGEESKDALSILLLARYALLPHFEVNGKLDPNGRKAAEQIRDSLQPKTA